jgi:hypothetical protein
MHTQHTPTCVLGGARRPTRPRTALHNAGAPHSLAPGVVEGGLGVGHVAFRLGDGVAQGLVRGGVLFLGVLQVGVGLADGVVEGPLRARHAGLGALQVCVRLRVRAGVVVGCARRYPLGRYAIARQTRPPNLLQTQARTPRGKAASRTLAFAASKAAEQLFTLSCGDWWGWRPAWFKQGRAGQGRAGQSKAGQGRAGQGRAGQGRARQGRAGQGRAGQGRAGQGRAGQGREQSMARPCSGLDSGQGFLLQASGPQASGSTGSPPAPSSGCSGLPAAVPRPPPCSSQARCSHHSWPGRQRRRPRRCGRTPGR